LPTAVKKPEVMITCIYGNTPDVLSNAILSVIAPLTTLHREKNHVAQVPPSDNLHAVGDIYISSF
jgi:hypothetical protein